MGAHRTITATASITLPDPDATGALAGTLARDARAGDVIGLGGPLGLGKTTFARAFINEIARLEGVPPVEVPSPTFTLVQLYEFRRASVYHFDLYRIECPDEVLELGIEDAFAEGISLIEWPERMAAMLPAERLELVLAAGPGASARIANMTGFAGWATRLETMFGDG